MAESRASMVDVVYPLIGARLPRDYRQALADELERVLPGLATWPGLGVHSVNVAPGHDSAVLLSQRARLALRVRRDQAAALAPLEGATLHVGDHEVRLGHAVQRELLPHGTLYSHLVTTSDDEELDFVATVDRELEDLGVRGRAICGRRHVLACDGLALTGFSLMLDGLSPSNSIQVLEAGVGHHRRLGCGVFVPHKSAAALRA
jgi:CRISPR-associated protein Cas6